MGTLNHSSVGEELTWLRHRVTELEAQSCEREYTSAALEESRALFDIFLLNIPSLAWMKDESGRYIYANRRFRDFVEKTGATCLGSTDCDLWPAALAERFSRADNAAFHGIQNSTEILPSAAGDRQFQIRRFPFSSRAGKRYIGGIAIDETARAERDAALEQNRLLYQSGVAGVLECEGERIVNANDLVLFWLGYTCQDVAAGVLNWNSLTPNRFRILDDLALAEAREEGSCRPYEKELLNWHGEPVPVIVTISKDKTSSRYFCQILNISDRKQTEDRLLRSQKLESLGLIAGGVAHDFNNLLASIMGNASLSVDALSQDHPASHFLNEVVIASRRASDLTRQVLAYSGRATVQIRPVNLSDAVREIGSLLETTISKKIALRFHLGRDLPPVESDEGQLQQVIMNLVINASDAIGENAGEIVVTTRAVGSGVSFEVRDTGCGMSNETRARIFDPFFTTKSDGRGLGLAAVLGIVRNHSGSLFVDTEVGKGTTFRVMFPAGNSVAAAEKAPHACGDLGGSETILIADDDESIRRMARIALERLGYRVLLASNGDEAVKVFAAHRNEIAAVVLDWAMPVMNGDEALEKIFAIDDGARVLMSSGYAEIETLQKVNAGRLAGFMQKPYTTSQLAGRLREVIACNQSCAETHAGA